MRNFNQCAHFNPCEWTAQLDHRLGMKPPARPPPLCQVETWTPHLCFFVPSCGWILRTWMVVAGCLLISTWLSTKKIAHVTCHITWWTPQDDDDDHNNNNNHNHNLASPKYGGPAHLKFLAAHRLHIPNVRCSPGSCLDNCLRVADPESQKIDSPFPVDIPLGKSKLSRRTRLE